jgi:hypothetical protein
MWGFYKKHVYQYKNMKLKENIEMPLAAETLTAL